MSAIRSLEREDLDAVARIHCSAFPRSALTRLGREAVRRYYLWQLVGPHEAMAVGVTVEGRLAGFCFAGVFRGALSGFLRANWGFLARRLAVRPWLLTDPMFRGRVRAGGRSLSSLRRSEPGRPAGVAPAGNAVAGGETSFGVLAIAVHPDYQGRGLGKAMMDLAETRARAGGYQAMHLSVDPSNVQAARFYEMLGWARLTGAGGWNGKMQRELDGSETGGGQAGEAAGRSEPMGCDPPMVSVLMPVRNEAGFIARSLGAVLAQDYPMDRLEVIVADGMSTDGTRETVRELGRLHGNIALLDNPGRIVATGLNLATRQARGEILVRVDGHCEIAPHYVRRCVAHLAAGRADGVGGPVRTVGDSPRAETIALAMASVFGVGGSAFRTTSGETTYADTIPFPAYTREIVTRAGLYDEELVRNQDDEYNYRIRKMGGRLLLASDVGSSYYSRQTLSALWRQYRQYGYWKVRVMQKHPRQMRWRQAVPPAFALTLLVTGAAAPISGAARRLLGLALGTYAAADMLASLIVARRHGRRHLPLLPAVFAVLHLGYGVGFLWGMVRFAGRWRQPASNPPATLPGGSPAGGEPVVARGRPGS